MTNKEKLLLIIVNAGFSDQAVEVAQECGASGATVITARGTGAHFVKLLGIHYEPEKEIILSVVHEDIGHKIIDEIKNKIGKDTPTSGICFMMPIDGSTLLN
ncbi:MAG: hypothetical protein LBM03_01035 [Erysipelotrichaceae bacterium]|jgi:nitrogen regulatory protein PII|nr:hypothetical protein [Erysipelotrichaceae bacterium]